MPEYPSPKEKMTSDIPVLTFWRRAMAIFNNLYAVGRYQKWIYGTTIGFIIINGLFIANEVFWFPVLSAVILVFYIAIYRIDILFYLLIFLTPLSVTLDNKNLNVAINAPSEPLMIAAMIALFVGFAYGVKITKKMLTHPVTIAVLLNLLCIFLTSITSELPLVSFKFFASRCWFLFSVYFLGLLFFNSIKSIRLFSLLYIIPLSGIIIYTLIRHGATGFDEHHAHWAMWPFYYDHTIYGAIIALFLPLLCGYLFSNALYRDTLQKVFIFFLLLLFCAGMVFSYTRAGWLSLAAGFLVFMFIKLRVRFSVLILIIAFITGYTIRFSDEITSRLEKNQKISSDVFAEHIQSIYNITTDVSNTERINRWKSAIRMFLERPLQGWGPGTYMFLYAPFQVSVDKTWVSTNAGNLGNAHSEYIGPLAESGIMGLLTFLAVILLTVYTALNFYFTVKIKPARIMMLVIFLGLVTYFVHGLLNNFLDTDKASVPFWGFIAAVTAMDVHYRKEEGKMPDTKT